MLSEEPTGSSLLQAADSEIYNMGINFAPFSSEPDQVLEFMANHFKSQSRILHELLKATATACVGVLYELRSPGVNYL